MGNVSPFGIDLDFTPFFTGERKGALIEALFYRLSIVLKGSFGPKVQCICRTVYDPIHP
jgi:hypothetical protein